MPAQLIVLGNFVVKNDMASLVKGKKKAAPPPPDQGQRAAPPATPKPPPTPPELPPFFPYPAGHVAVFGQEPQNLGRFSDMYSLLDELQIASIGSASQTVFATVTDVKTLNYATIYDGLAKLPDKLTIFVKPESL